MEAITSFFNLLSHLITAMEFLAVAIIAALIAISVLPYNNPLRLTLQALCQRLMMTLGASVLAVPVEIIPGLDLAYDIGAPLVLGWAWFTFCRDVLRTVSPPVPSRPGNHSSPSPLAPQANRFPTMRSAAPPRRANDEQPRVYDIEEP